MAQFELKALITGVDRLSPLLGHLQRRFSRLRRSAWRMGRGGREMALGLSAGMASSLTAFAKQQSAATNLKVAMMQANGAVDQTFFGLNKLATQLGNTLPGATTDFQNMMQMLIRQGISADKILAGTGKAAAYLAVQLNQSPQSAATFAAKMQDATRTLSRDMMPLFDLIQKSFYLGVDSSNMLAFFTKVSAVSSLVNDNGLQAAQTLAPVAVMMDQMGMAGEQSGNAVRKMVQSVLDLKKVDRVNAMIQSLGVHLNFVTQQGKFAGIKVLIHQLQQLKSLSDVQNTQVLKTLFGGDAETLQVVNQLIAQAQEGYDRITAKMRIQATLQQRVQAQLATLSSLFDSLKGNAVNALAAIGSAFGNDASSIIGSLNHLSARLTRFVQHNPAVVRSLVALVAGITALKLALLGMNAVLTLFSASPAGLAIRGLILLTGVLISNWQQVNRLIRKCSQPLQWLARSTDNYLKWVGKGMMYSPSSPPNTSWRPENSASHRAPRAAEFFSAAPPPSSPASLKVVFENLPAGARVSDSGHDWLSYDVGYSPFSSQNSQ